LTVEEPDMLRNRHDTWKLFCELQREILDRTGVPTSLTHSRQRFRDFLETGEAAVSVARISLADLTPPQWAALNQFAAVFFREFESFAPEDLFPAFRRETRKRGDKFPR
jgi:hypothetical protein